MDIRVVNNVKDFDRLKISWNDIAERADVHIFQTFEWNRTWWKYFGIEDNLHIILFYDDDRLVGIAPLFWDSIHLLRKKIYRCLRFLGSNVYQPKGEPLIGFIAYSDYLDLIVEPGYEDQISRELIQHLRSENISYDEIVFEEVPEQSSILTHLAPMLKEKGTAIMVEESSSCANLILDGSWDDYMAKLTSRDRNKTRKYIKKLEDKDEKLFEVETISDHFKLSSSYETLVRVHQGQWNDKNFPGFFYEKRMHDFMKEVSHEFVKKDWMHIKKFTPLEDEEKCVGIYLLFKFKKRLYGIIGGMDHTSPYISEGIGHISFIETLREAIEKNFEVFDFIRGLQDYKLRTSDIITTNSTVSLPHSEAIGNRRIQFAKKMIHVQRRLRVEFIQFKLSFKNRRFVNGLKNYSSFLAQRIKYKKASLAS